MNTKYRSFLFLLAFLFFSVELQAQSLDYIMNMVHNNPGEKPFDTKYVDPTYLKSQGFKAAVLFCHINTGITYDNFEKNVVPKGSEERKWIENKALVNLAKIHSYKAVGLNVYAFTDFLVFPKSIWDKYGDQIEAKDTKEDNPGGIAERARKPDIQRKMTQKLLITQIDDIFSHFPELDGIVLRFGETYLQDTPFHRGGSPISNNDEQSIKDHILLINILREEICVKRNKKLFYRTWDFGNRFHVNPKYYLAVTNAIEPHPNLFFSIKYQQGDFQRMTPFNPCIGIGKHRQIIESQSQMEGYGKGSHPYYTGSGVINGWPETKYELNWQTNGFTGKLNPPDAQRGVKDILKNGLLAGIWTWSNGGGWEGPYLKNEIWNDLNNYVVSHWAMDVSRPEETLFREFTDRMGLSGINADIFRQIALLSIEGVRKGQLNSYTDNSVWWARDQFFSAESNTKIVKSILDKHLEKKVLAEKTEAVAIWRQMEALSNQLEMKDSITLEAIRVSCTYGRIKFALIEQMWILMIEDGNFKLKGEMNKEVVRKAIQKYDDLWAEWRLLKNSSSQCASLYTDKAFMDKREGSIGEMVDNMREMVK
ncbi:MAG: hypothetical protein Q8908_14345 [Bacteroidota bacterium]|nr:hypothetical protein [Bacteroidota bacterium]